MSITITVGLEERRPVACDPYVTARLGMYGWSLLDGLRVVYDDVLPTDVPGRRRSVEQGEGRTFAPLVGPAP